MFKGVAILLFCGFLILSSLLKETSGGSLFYPLWIAASVLGWASLGFMSLPQAFFRRVLGPVRAGVPQDSDSLARQMEAISKTVREEGLLALESRKKEFLDPNLRIYLKRIVEGFEAKDLAPMIRNQLQMREELFTEAEKGLARYFSFLPVLGLIQSLLLISKGIGANSAMNFFEGFFPFLAALSIQTLLETTLFRWLSDERAEGLRYFSILEEGIEGIQQGHHPELLGDRLRARISPGVRRVDS
jgi:flagellar motor component MotA